MSAKKASRKKTSSHKNASSKKILALPSTLSLLKATVQQLKYSRKLFAGIALTYALLLVLFTGALISGYDVATSKQLLQELAGSQGAQASNLTSSLTLFGGLFAGTGDDSQAAGVYQSIIVLMSSLAFVWAYRQTYGQINESGAHKNTAPKLKVRDAFYAGMYPLVPALFVLCMIGIGLLPVVLASGIYGTMISAGLAVGVIEQSLWAFGIGALIAFSLYLLTSWSLAFYVVSLPNVYPRDAIKAARRYVSGRRMKVLSKMFLLAILLLSFIVVVVLPAILFVPAIAELLFFVTTIGCFVIMHGFMYNLYRALLK